MGAGEDRALPPDLARTLDEVRRRRAFDAAEWLASMVALLGRYLGECGLRAAVVGVSGGIDSAVVAGLLARLRDEAAPTELRMVGAVLPVHDPSAATGQHDAVARAHQVIAHFGLERAEVDLTATHAALCDAVDAGAPAEVPPAGPWARGQAVANCRTPALYHLATVLTAAGWPAVVVGTTNRSEGGYLGYIGKAADAMVDLQILGQLTKHEVRAVAEVLGVPQVVRTATPTGDMFDGRTDEDVFGTSYDALELYLDWLVAPESERARWADAWSDESARVFARWAQSLDDLHAANAHKYRARSPAIHLDVLDRPAIPGGWRYATWAPASG